MPELDSSDRVPELLRDIELALGAATSQVRNDLERARMVVSDATARLDRSIRTLHAATGRHSEVLLSVVDALLDRGGEGRSLTKASEALLQQFVEQIVRVSHGGMRIIHDLSRLSDSVRTIAGCANSMDILARETRFIAFNARIETHRAGDAGRTFKVVADEVKRLATMSTALGDQIRQAAGDCHTLVAGVNSTATGFVSLDMSNVLESHKLMTESVGKLDGVNRSLGQMLEELDVGIAEAVRALQFEDMVSQIVNATVQRVTSMSQLSIQALHAMQGRHGRDRTAPLTEVRNGMRLLGTNSAVQQQSMEQGTVELF